MADTTYRTVSRQRRLALGFTLIELLVVIAIISLLVSILLPSLTKAKELARKTVCATNVRSMVLGLNLFANENDGMIPGAFVGQSVGIVVGSEYGGPGVTPNPRTFGSAAYELYANYQVPAQTFFCPSIVNSIGTSMGSPEAFAAGLSTPGGWAWSHYVGRVSQPGAGENMASPWRIATYQLEGMSNNAIMSEYYCSTYLVSGHPFASLNGPGDMIEGGWNIGYSDGSARFVEMEPLVELVKTGHHVEYIYWPTYWLFWAGADGM